MTTHPTRPLQIASGIYQKFLVFALLALLLGTIPLVPQPPRPARADRALLGLAAQNPAGRLAVIVRKTPDASGVEQRVGALGGRITASLQIINAFAADLPAARVAEVAREQGVSWVSPDAPVASTACTECVSVTSSLINYIKAIRADKVWADQRQGQGISVAVLDSGVNSNADLYTVTGRNRQLANIAFNAGWNTSVSDAYGHGTHIASVIGGNGRTSGGRFVGVAPLANIINIKVSDDLSGGSGTAKSVVQGLQWILENKSKYNIRVVNISINSAVNESYHSNPIDAALEILWFNGIVVVVSAGNGGSGVVYPPANDPFVITVGAADDRGTLALTDDTVASFSSYGTTIDGFSKPDLVAPGKNIVGMLSSPSASLAVAHPANIVDKVYFRMSGTSVSAPMVAGAAALLLQDEPNLTPDQVKSRLLSSANKSWPGYQQSKAGAGYLDAYAALVSSSLASANLNIAPSKALSTGSNPLTWSSVNWNSVNWNSVNWNSVNWNSVNWNSVNWNSVSWDN